MLCLMTVKTQKINRVMVMMNCSTLSRGQITSLSTRRWTKRCRSLVHRRSPIASDKRREAPIFQNQHSAPQHQPGCPAASTWAFVCVHLSLLVEIGWDTHLIFRLAVFVLRRAEKTEDTDHWHWKRFCLETVEEYLHNQHVYHHVNWRHNPIQMLCWWCWLWPGRLCH